MPKIVQQINDLDKWQSRIVKMTLSEIYQLCFAYEIKYKKKIQFDLVDQLICLDSHTFFTEEQTMVERMAINRNQMQFLENRTSLCYENQQFVNLIEHIINKQLIEFSQLYQFSFTNNFIQDLSEIIAYNLLEVMERKKYQQQNSAIQGLYCYYLRKPVFTKQNLQDIQNKNI